MCSMQLTHIIELMRKIGLYALDTIAPPHPIVRAIEGMSAAEFAQRARINTPETGTGDLSSKQPPTAVIAFFPYRNELMRTALVELKTFRNRHIEKNLGIIMRDEMSKHPLITGILNQNQKTLLLPIPMTRKSIRARGWNQCELIAREISIADGGRLFEMRGDLLAKTRETGDQVGKTRVGRLENLKSCMVATDNGYVQGRDVIVIDDIVTTGATLGEAKRALLQAGARAVICVAVAF